MKSIISSVFFILILLKVFANEEVHWLKDLEKAKQVSARNKNLIVILIKDDSFWSQKLERLIAGFGALGKNNLSYTLCMLSLEEISKVYNGPAILLIHPKYGLIAKIGYIPIDAGGLDDYIKEMVNNFEKIKTVALNAKNFDSKELEKAFLLSKEMESVGFQEELLEEGLKRSDTAFFAFEKYEMLINKFPYEDERIKNAKEEIRSKDPKNIQKYHLKLAMLDFLTLSKAGYDAKAVIKPLTDYASLCGEKDKQNLWKIYMTISQFFLGKKSYRESLNYAREANKKAPRSVKKYIQSSIQYLRRKVNIHKK